MANWLGRHKKKIIKGLLGLLILAAALYGLCFYMSYKAADIFNRTVAERQLFPGTVTVERLTATPGGTVSFENLIWIDEEGNPLVKVPDGEFTVKISDILTGRIGTRTLETVTLNQAYLHLIFNDKMELQHIKSNPGDSEKKGKKVIELTGPRGNRPFNCRIVLRHSTIEAESPDRHFTIEDVDLDADIHTKGKTDINLQAGPFSGTVAAKSLRIRGGIDFAPETPQYDLFLLLTDCNPKSLGAGLDIDDPATVSADIKGPLDKPVIDGILTMDKLDITTLVFTDVKGQVHYEKGRLDISDVTAGVFGGSMKGRGQINLDDKSYTADIVGTQLQGSLAAHDLFLRCDVDLNLHMEENRTTGTKAIYGDFWSGPGRYHGLPFRGISGSFAQDGKELHFQDVVISMFFGDVSTDALSIVDGKVHMGTIHVNYKDGSHSHHKGPGSD